MNCFVIFEGARQIKVYGYDRGSFRDRERARALAIKMAEAHHHDGRPCTVEEFLASGVGTTIHDTTKP